MTIHVYGIGYRVVNNIVRSISSIVDNASEKVNFIYCDSRSINSEQIKDEIQYLCDMGKVQRGVFFSKNIKGNALIRSYKMFPPDNSEDFVVLTDLDLIVDFDWISEIRANLKRNVLTGFSLSRENYNNTPNYGHTEVEEGMGVWLMGVKKKILNKYPKDSSFLDDWILQFAQDYGNIYRSRKTLYHLGWDLWKDDPEYFEEKKNGTDWDYNAPAEVEIIQ